MDINEVMSYLPHRYPFLLIDRVVEVEAGNRVHGYKNVTYNEPFFTGHFPERPILPGVIMLEALAQAGFFALSCSVVVHADIAAHYVLNMGTEAQKEKYLSKMASGECIGAICMTEPGAGSDLQGLKTTAITTDYGWSISGSKTFITNGQNADLYIIAARTNLEVATAKGLSLFLVDGDSEGFSRGQNLTKIGQHAADTSELFLDNVKVTEDDLLGEVDKGFAGLMNELPRERLSLACTAVAHAEGALELAKNYVMENDKPLAAYIFTKNKQQENEWVNEISAGNQCINDVIMFNAVPDLPFGGTGPSGMGQYSGKTGFDNFSHQKSVLKRPFLKDLPVRFAPYTDFKFKFLRFLR